jgi:glycosyltransferase involved in cell wall biosynthesis
VSAVNIEQINGCVLIPTYNNEKTLKSVLDSLLRYISPQHVIVVNDGSSDSTAEILAHYNELTVLSNDKNRGKGYSLRKGFRCAIEKKYAYAITLDSDGQHSPDDLPQMIATCLQHPDTVLMGSRNMQQEGVPAKSSFGNKFSNFWFKVETWISLPDTQTGFRVYPLKPMRKMRLFTSKFELEIEVIVRLAWKGVPFLPVPISVKYDFNERVSHFRPARDFLRISVLNSVLVILALLYYYPKILFSQKTWSLIKNEAIKPNESNAKKSLSLGFGVFMGIFPVWGFQLLIGIPLAILFRLNKVLFITAANISIPPMIPFIIYGSFIVGQYFTADSIDPRLFTDFSLETIKLKTTQYFIGAIILSCISFFIVTVTSYFLLSFFRRKRRIAKLTP